MASEVSLLAVESGLISRRKRRRRFLLLLLFCWMLFFVTAASSGVGDGEMTEDDVESCASCENARFTDDDVREYFR